jgi:transposase
VVQPFPIEAGEFTIGEFAEAAGVCYATASRWLAEMAEEGKLLRRKVRSEEGREVWGFRLVRGEM